MKKFLISSFVTVFALLAVLVVPLSVTKVSADSGSASYDYLIGSGFICGLGPDVCPDVAKAPNGDTVAIAGAGTLSVHPKSVSGGGTFVHKNASGDVLASGTWTATKLLSFDNYGCGGPGLPDFACGGRAQIQVHLSVGLDAVLWVDCVLGNPPTGAMEGVRLNVPGIINFNKEVSGDTLFIKT